MLSHRAAMVDNVLSGGTIKAPLNGQVDFLHRLAVVVCGRAVRSQGYGAQCKRRSCVGTYIVIPARTTSEAKLLRILSYLGYLLEANSSSSFGT